MPRFESGPADVIDGITITPARQQRLTLSEPARGFVVGVPGGTPSDPCLARHGRTVLPALGAWLCSLRRVVALRTSGAAALAWADADADALWAQLPEHHEPLHVVKVLHEACQTEPPATS